MKGLFLLFAFLLCGMGLAQDCGKAILSIDDLFRTRVVDRNHVPLAGRLHVTDKGIYFFPDWAEPIFLGTTEPFQLEPQIELREGWLVLGNVVVVF